MSRLGAILAAAVFTCHGNVIYYQVLESSCVLALPTLLAPLIVSNLHKKSVEYTNLSKCAKFAKCPHF